MRIKPTLLALVLMGSSPAGAGEIAVIFSKNIKPYQEAFSGFSNVCDARVKKKYDMKGEVDRSAQIASDINSLEPDLVLAIGSEALGIAKEIKDIPVVFAMILYPEAIVGDMDNVTGASAQTPVEEQLETLRAIGSNVESIGVVYDPTNTESLVAEISRVAKKKGFQLVAVQAYSLKEVTTHTFIKPCQG